jgi:hypothetical protein
MKASHPASSSREGSNSGEADGGRPEQKDLPMTTLEKALNHIIKSGEE